MGQRGLFADIQRLYADDLPVLSLFFSVDPFVIPGDAGSGLLPGISNPAKDAPGEFGSGDKRVQAYNFRMFLAKMPDAIPFPKPTTYDPRRYELLARYIAARGSVTVDGVSLTVNDVEGAEFGVNIIPHTAAVTSFGALRVGDPVNIEIDTLARYVARLQEYR